MGRLKKVENLSKSELVTIVQQLIDYRDMDSLGVEFTSILKVYNLISQEEYEELTGQN